MTEIDWLHRLWVVFFVYFYTIEYTVRTVILTDVRNCRCHQCRRHVPVLAVLV